MNGFILYSEHYEAVKELSLEQKGALLDCLYRYALNGEEPTEDDPLVRLSFAFLRASMDAARAKYDAKCARLRENGKKGGAPKGNGNAKKKKDEPKEPAAEAVENRETSQDSKRTPPPYGDIMARWNDGRKKAGSSMRPITLMTDARRALIRARLDECGGDVSAIYRAIDNALASRYLNGGNDSGWMGTFDWVMSARNFAKVLDGNYADKPGDSKAADAELAKAMAEASAAQRAALEDRAAKERQRMLDYIATVRTRPNKFMYKVLVGAYESGHLKRLGINWTPEEVKNTG